MNRKIIVLLTCLFVFFSFNISACKTKSISTKGSDMDSKNEQKLDLGGRVVTVGVWSQNLVPVENDSTLNSDEAKLVNRVRLECKQEAERKYNCQINYKVLPRDYASKLIQDMQAGIYIADILMLNSNNGILSMIQNGLIIPLDDYIDFTSGPFANDAQKASLWEGRHYGLSESPVRIGYGILIYNKTLLQKENLPDPFQLQHDGQWTWNAFLDIAKKTTADTNGDGVTDQWGLADRSYASVYEGFLFSNGADFTTESDGKVVFGLTDPAATEALQFVTDLYKVYKVVRVGNPFSQDQNSNQRSQDLLMNGKFAFYNVSSFFNSISTYNIPNAQTSQANMEYGIVLFPKGPSASKHITYSPGGGYYSIPSTVKNPDMIASVMKDLLSTYDTSRSSFIDANNIFNNLSENDRETLKMAMENLRYSWFMDEPGYANLFDNVFTSLVRDNKTINEAVGAIRYSVESNLNKLNQSN